MATNAAAEDNRAPADIKPLLKALEPPGVSTSSGFFWLAYISDALGQEELCPLSLVPRPASLKITPDVPVAPAVAENALAELVAAPGGAGSAVRGGRGRGGRGEARG